MWGVLQVTLSPGTAEWSHIRDEALALTDEIEEDDNLALREFQVCCL